MNLNAGEMEFARIILGNSDVGAIPINTIKRIAVSVSINEYPVLVIWTSTISDNKFRCGVLCNDELEISFLECRSSYLQNSGFCYASTKIIIPEKIHLWARSFFPTAYRSIILIVNGRMSPRQSLRLLRNATKCLHPGGSILHVSKGLWCPITEKLRSRMQLTSDRLHVDFSQIVPISLYKLSKLRR